MPTLNTLANIGAITLQCHRVAKFGKATPYELKQVDLGMKEIPETAKKAGAHKISYVLDIYRRSGCLNLL